MREIVLTVLILLALMSQCAILVFATRGLDKSDKDRDNVIMTIIRGLGTFIALYCHHTNAIPLKDYTNQKKK